MSYSAKLVGGALGGQKTYLHQSMMIVFVIYFFDNQAISLSIGGIFKKKRKKACVRGFTGTIFALPNNESCWESAGVI